MILSVTVLPPPLWAERGLKMTAEIAPQRLALVIGNSSYKNYPLRNPANDAQDMARALKNNGFEVILKLDATQKEMVEGADTFGKKLRDGGTGLFYYAGHGMQMGGDNYLIPIDADITSESDVKWEGVAAGRILGKMEDAGNDLNIIILDACRNNPFARSFRSAEKGLAKMDAPKGSLIAYATSPGNVASDGEGRNAPYTKHLLREIQKEGLKIEEVLKNVRIAVMKETADRQVPWESSSLTGNFYFIKSQSGHITINTTESHGEKKMKKEVAASSGGKITVQKKATSPAEWSAWQEKMHLNFLIAERYDNLSELTFDEKLTVWQTFLKDYPVDNPTSDRDDVLRDKALTRLAYWRAVKARSIKEHQVGLHQPGSNSAKLEEVPPTVEPREIASDGNFILYDNKTVVDRRTGLMWAAHDNGHNITWNQAKSYCENYRGGGFSDWRMPTRDELASLYDKTKSYQAPKKGYAVHLTSLIQLDTCCPWATEIHGTEGAIFHFGYGIHSWRNRENAYFSRVLPVRQTPSPTR